MLFHRLRVFLILGLWFSSAFATDLTPEFACFKSIIENTQFNQYVKTASGAPVFLERGGELFSDSTRQPILGQALPQDGDRKISLENMLLVIPIYEEHLYRTGNYPTGFLALTSHGAYRFSLPQSPQWTGILRNGPEEDHSEMAKQLLYYEFYNLHLKSDDGNVDAFLSLSRDIFDVKEDFIPESNHAHFEYSGNGKLFTTNEQMITENRLEQKGEIMPFEVQMTPIPVDAYVFSVLNYNIARSFATFYRNAELNSAKQKATSSFLHYDFGKTNPKILSQVDAVLEKRAKANEILAQEKAKLSWYSHLSYHLNGPSGRDALEAARNKVFSDTAPDLIRLRDEDKAGRLARVLDSFHKMAKRFSERNRSILAACGGLTGNFYSGDGEKSLGLWMLAKGEAVAEMMDESKLPRTLEDLFQMGFTSKSLLFLGVKSPDGKRATIGDYVPFWWP